MVMRYRADLVEMETSLASDFLRFEQHEDRLFHSHSSAALSYLRVELARIRPGMSDFLIRVSTPKIDGQPGVDKSNIMVTIRGSKQFSSAEGAEKIAMTISKQMHARGDQTHAWETADIVHLSKMLQAPLKFFGSNISSTLLRFSTDALA